MADVHPSASPEEVAFIATLHALGKQAAIAATLLNLYSRHAAGCVQALPGVLIPDDVLLAMKVGLDKDVATLGIWISGLKETNANLRGILDALECPQGLLVRRDVMSD